MSVDNILIHWFRQDLRLRDNPALFNAAKQGRVLPIYILDDVNAAKASMGAASRWWLHHSLHALNNALGGRLQIYRGDPQAVLMEITKTNPVKGVYWNRCYEPWCINRDKRIKSALKASGIEVQSYNGSLLWEPWHVLKKDNTPYKVFTPFYRRGCLSAQVPREPIPLPDSLLLVERPLRGLDITALKLLPSNLWYQSLEEHWEIGEAEAYKQLQHFLDKGLSDYKHGRNFPAKPNVSRLSSHLHFGEVSPNQVWQVVRMQGDDDNIDHFCSELGWREFSYYLLYHFPSLPEKNLNAKFDHFPWQDNTEWLARWQSGQTGYPIVDAGMRELWQTGYMHNRLRMIVGSFLVKNLRLHWHHGERWFWDCLVDADLANNSAGWQWIAGCGADAAPYFRIFNPVTQGYKFDPDGKYTRRFVPELAELPNQYLFSPWEAPESVLKKAGIKLGQNYPAPIVDLKQSRQQALEAFSALKTRTD